MHLMIPRVARQLGPVSVLSFACLRPTASMNSPCAIELRSDLVFSNELLCAPSMAAALLPPRGFHAEYRAHLHPFVTRHAIRLLSHNEC